MDRFNSSGPGSIPCNYCNAVRVKSHDGLCDDCRDEEREREAVEREERAERDAVNSI